MNWLDSIPPYRWARTAVALGAVGLVLAVVAAVGLALSDGPDDAAFGLVGLAGAFFGISALVAIIIG